MASRFFIAATILVGCATTDLERRTRHLEEEVLRLRAEVGRLDMRAPVATSAPQDPSSIRPRSLDVVVLTPHEADPTQTSGGAPSQESKVFAILSSAQRAGDCAKVIDASATYLVRYPAGPRTPDALYFRGTCFATLGDTPRAKENLNAFLAKGPNDPRAKQAAQTLAQLSQRERSNTTEDSP